ncbi:MAG: Sulfate transport system permease protein CysT [Myxococcota bacterium]|nr:Sulfate transport system permease protein CysT [Myxococcota bacterium]
MYSRSILPGFNSGMSLTLLYLGMLVVLPLISLVFKTAELTWDQYLAVVTSPRALHAFWLSFGAAIAGAAVNLFFGLLLAWALVRYEFPGRRLLDAMVDLPFALPTSVAGISLTALFAPSGWLGGLLAPLGIKVAYTVLGVMVAMIFVGLPFVVRSVQPVLEDLSPEIEEAALMLGANRWQTFIRVILPGLWPALLTGFALSFARAVGEYGSVVFISGNMPMKTEIAPLLIMTRLEQFDYPAATAIASVMLAVSFVLLFAINKLQAWSQRSLEA